MLDRARPRVLVLATPALETHCDHHVRTQACPSWAEAIALAAETYRTWVEGTVLEQETCRTWAIAPEPERDQPQAIALELEPDRLLAIDPTEEDLPQVS